MSDADNKDTPRTAEEIARRAIALHCAVAVAQGVSQKQVSKWLRAEELWNELTPRELKLFSDPPTPKEIRWMSWLVEAQFALLWAIKKLSSLPKPTAKCDTALVMAAMPGLFEPTLPFIESAVLQSRTTILKAEAKLYDIHCQVDQATRHRKPIPGGYDKDVVFFRHYGLCWVRGYCGLDWDDVTPDA